jgi:hypothetical protein
MNYEAGGGGELVRLCQTQLARRWRIWLPANDQLSLWYIAAKNGAVQAMIPTVWQSVGGFLSIRTPCKTRAGIGPVGGQSAAFPEFQHKQKKELLISGIRLLQVGDEWLALIKVWRAHAEIVIFQLLKDQERILTLRGFTGFRI